MWPEWHAGGDAGLPRGWGSASAGTRSPSDSCSEALTGLLRLTPAPPRLPGPAASPPAPPRLPRPRARDSRVHAQHHDVLPQVPGSHHFHDADLLGPPGKLLLQLCRERGPVSHAWPGPGRQPHRQPNARRRRVFFFKAGVGPGSQGRKLATETLTRQVQLPTGPAGRRRDTQSSHRVGSVRR